MSSFSQVDIAPTVDTSDEIDVDAIIADHKQRSETPTSDAHQEVDSGLDNAQDTDNDGATDDDEAFDSESSVGDIEYDGDLRSMVPLDSTRCRVLTKVKDKSGATVPCA